jgi:hypothetical protein
MASSTKEKVINSISPAALVAIVIMNLLLIFLMFENLENQTRILQDVQENTELTLENQQLALNLSDQNHELLELVIQTQQLFNQTFRNFADISADSLGSDLS